jgi:hypothetical protein
VITVPSIYWILAAEAYGLGLKPREKNPALGPVGAVGNSAAYFSGEFSKAL